MSNSNATGILGAIANRLFGSSAPVAEPNYTEGSRKRLEEQFDSLLVKEVSSIFTDLQNIASGSKPDNLYVEVQSPKEVDAESIYREKNTINPTKGSKNSTGKFTYRPTYVGDNTKAGLDSSFNFGDQNAAKYSRKASRYNELYELAGRTYNVDPRLIKAIVMQESNGDPNAKSGAGATGLMQLMPDTANYLNADPKNLIHNVFGGAKYIAMMLNYSGGNIHLATASYNAGPGRVKSFLKTNNKLLDETIDYMNKVPKIYALLHKTNS